MKTKTKELFAAGCFGAGLGAVLVSAAGINGRCDNRTAAVLFGVIGILLIIISVIGGDK